MSPSGILVKFPNGKKRSDTIKPGESDVTAAGTGMVSCVSCSEDDQRTIVQWNSKPTVWRKTEAGSNELLSQHTTELIVGQKLTILRDTGFDGQGRALQEEMTITHVIGGKERE